MTRNRLGFQEKPLKVGLEFLEQSLQSKQTPSVSAFKFRANQSLRPGSGEVEGLEACCYRKDGA